MTIDVLIGACVAAALAVPAWRLRALDATGAVAAIVAGAVIFGLGGLSASLALVFFFVSGSVLSALPKPRTFEPEFERNGRSWKQVAANGLVPMLAIIMTRLAPSHEAMFLHAYFGSVAAACADSWGTEAGMRYGRSVRDVLSGDPLQTGLSGGMSLFGTLASLAGSGLVVLAIALPLAGLRFERTSSALLAIVIGGFLGSVADSVLGSSVQAKYRCETCNSFAETPSHCGEPAKLIAGYEQVRNNTVNFAASAIAALFTVIMLDIA